MTSAQSRQLSLRALIVLVVGSMIGSGIFALPAAFGRATGALGALIAWAIAGTGMLMLAFVFQTLSRRRPDLDAGIYAYAKAGFGDYLGFASAFGYWIACCLADVALPVLRGVKQAAAPNSVATVAKIVPLVIFVAVAIAGFRVDIFALNFWGGEAPAFANISTQVRNTMLVTVFVFVGIEGASVYSRYAKNRADVDMATVLGFLGVLAPLVMVTMLSYGTLLRPDLAATRETYDADPQGRDKDVVVGALAALYALAMTYSGGLKFVLLAALLYAPGTILFRMARRQKGAPVFASAMERILFGVTAVAALVALYGLATGAISV